jgi:hypothetical protein
MAKDFPSDSLPSGDRQSETPAREPLRVMLIGSREGVIEAMHSLHHKNFADVNGWSPLLPSANPGEVMSIYTRYRQR